MITNGKFGNLSICWLATISISTLLLLSVLSWCWYEVSTWFKFDNVLLYFAPFSRLLFRMVYWQEYRHCHLVLAYLGSKLGVLFTSSTSDEIDDLTSLLGVDFASTFLIDIRTVNQLILSVTVFNTLSDSVSLIKLIFLQPLLRICCLFLHLFYGSI
jgi:hypothetical protein